MKVTRDKRGVPCLWESGGGSTNTGNATLIAGPHGEKKVPVYIRRAGQLSCGDHAMVPIEVGDTVVTANHHRGDFSVVVFRIKRIGEGLGIGPDDEALLVSEYIFDMNQWNSAPTTDIMAVVEAAKDKAKKYHCREAQWIKNPNQEVAVPPHQEVSDA